MKKNLSIKRLFIKILLLLSPIYIGLGWFIGLNYARKPVIFGPYPDIPIVMKTSLLGSSFKEISGAHALVMVAPPEGDHKNDQDSTYFKIPGYFEVPGTWRFEIPLLSEKNNKFIRERTFKLTGNYSRAIAHEFKNPEQNLGSLSVSQLNGFLKATGRTKDMERLKPYLFLERLEDKYPWAYSETVLLSKAMSNIFSEEFIPYDILGLVGIVVLFIALGIRSVWLWMYYLCWVFAYWFGRIGYHDPSLAFSDEGWQVILWSFWNGFIMKEGRLFLVVALGLSVINFGISGILYMVKQIAVFQKKVN